MTAISYRQLMIDARVHDELTDARTALSQLLFSKPSVIGLSAMIAVLMDHWRESPPNPEWVRKRRDHVPKRGRPRKSEPLA
jgi:hypothetical protein